MWGNCTPDPDYLLSRAGTGVNFCEQDDEMLKRIEYINYGEDIAVIGYSPSAYAEGHAVVCLGMEYRDDADDWNTNRRNPAWENGIMDARILTYNVNHNGFSYGDSLYIDFETGKWNWNGNSSEKLKIYCPFYRIELYSKKENYLLNQTHNLDSMELINRLLSIRS